MSQKGCAKRRLRRGVDAERRAVRARRVGVDRQRAVGARNVDDASRRRFTKSGSMACVTATRFSPTNGHVIGCGGRAQAQRRSPSGKQTCSSNRAGAVFCVGPVLLRHCSSQHESGPQCRLIVSKAISPEGSIPESSPPTAMFIVTSQKGRWPTRETASHRSTSQYLSGGVGVR